MDVFLRQDPGLPKNGTRRESRFHRATNRAEPLKQFLPDQGCLGRSSLRPELPTPVIESHRLFPAGLWTDVRILACDSATRRHRRMYIRLRCCSFLVNWTPCSFQKRLHVREGTRGDKCIPCCPIHFTIIDASRILLCKEPVPTL